MDKATVNRDKYRYLPPIVTGIIAAVEGVAVIPSRSNYKIPRPYCKISYKSRNAIERCFNRLKHFRRIATRYDRKARHFLAFLYLASCYALSYVRSSQNAYKS